MQSIVKRLEALEQKRRAEEPVVVVVEYVEDWRSDAPIVVERQLIPVDWPRPDERRRADAAKR